MSSAVYRILKVSWNLNAFLHHYRGGYSSALAEKLFFSLKRAQQLSSLQHLVFYSSRSISAQNTLRFTPWSCDRFVFLYSQLFRVYLHMYHSFEYIFISSEKIFTYLLLSLKIYKKEKEKNPHQITCLSYVLIVSRALLTNSPIRSD